MAHVFQVMAGNSRLGDGRSHLSGTSGLLEPIIHANGRAEFFDSAFLFAEHSPSHVNFPCPICKCQDLLTLRELGSIPVPSAEDDEIIPEIRIGATGIVMPDRIQLARWFKVPVPPRFKRSKLHASAIRDGRQHATFTFFSTFSFETVFFTPNLITLSVALAASMLSGLRSWSRLKKLACEEDRGIALELTVRKHAYQARNTAWEKLNYCSGCGMVHDRDGKRSLPWYSML